MKKLEHLVSLLVEYSHTTNGELLTSEFMLKLLDVLKPSRKVEICKDILDTFARTHASTNDPILIHTVFDLARTVHDSIDSLSPEGEQRHISSLISGFIAKVDFGKDLEQQLNIYVECRAAFANLDAVKDRLILAVARLAMKAHKFMKGRHTKKTSAFVKACLAYCHITIPSIDDVFRRLHLQLVSANIALLNQCLPQTDTFLKAAITTIPDVPPIMEADKVEYKRVHSEARLASFLRMFWSTLVIVPGHPEHGPFYLVQGLLNAMPRFAWQAHTGVQTSLYIWMLPLLSTFMQRKLPYTIERVESNDVLYGGSAEYLEELRTHLATVMQAIVTQLAALGDVKDGYQNVAEARRIELVLDLANQLANHVTLDESVSKFVHKLLDLATSKKDAASIDVATRAYLANTRAFIARVQTSQSSGGAHLLRTAQ